MRAPFFLAVAGLFGASQAQSYSAGSFNIPPEEFCPQSLVYSYFQNDGNLVVYASGSAVWASAAEGGKTVNNDACVASNCNLVFQGDGNLVSYYNGGVLWASNTAGSGSTFRCNSAAPYLEIFNSAGSVVWSTGGGRPICPGGCCEGEQSQGAVLEGRKEQCNAP